MATEYKNLTELLELIPAEKKAIAKSLIAELNFMKTTLVKLRKDIKERGPVEHFEQGKQKFLRESPALKAYNTTLRQYSLLYKQLTDLLPKDAGKVEEVNPLYDFINGE